MLRARTLQVLVAFRVLGSRKHEHPLNKAAVFLTASRRAKHGRLCHAELMMQVQPGVWVRFGIVKKSYGGDDGKGNPIFIEGRMHAKVVDQVRRILRARPREPAARRACVASTVTRHNT